MMKSEFGKMARDIRFASRMLLKSPGFTALALLTLGLGIGAVSVFLGLFDEDPLRIRMPIASHASGPIRAPT